MLIRACYIIARSGLLLIDRVYGNADTIPDSIMVSSFFTALLTFSNESVKQLAEALDKSASTVLGSNIVGFTYGNLRFLFFQQEQVFLVLVAPRSADLQIIIPLGERILEKFLNTYKISVDVLSNPDMSKYEPFQTEIDRILVENIDLNPVKSEIDFFKVLLTVV